MNLFNFFGRQKKREKEENQFKIEKVNAIKIVWQESRKCDNNWCAAEFKETTVDGKKYLLKLEQSQYNMGTSSADPHVSMSYTYYKNSEISVFDLRMGKQVLRMAAVQSKGEKDAPWRENSELIFTYAEGAEVKQVKAVSNQKGWGCFKDYAASCGEGGLVGHAPRHLDKTIMAKFDKLIAQNPDAKALYLEAPRATARQTVQSPRELTSKQLVASLSLQRGAEL